MGGYSCEECLHHSCYTFSEEAPDDDRDCAARAKGYPNKPVWIWNGKGADPRGVDKT